MDKFTQPKATRVDVALDAAAQLSGVVVANPASSSTDPSAPEPPPPPAAGPSGTVRKTIRGR